MADRKRNEFVAETGLGNCGVLDTLYTTCVGCTPSVPSTSSRTFSVRSAHSSNTAACRYGDASSFNPATPFLQDFSFGVCIVCSVSCMHASFG